MLPGRETTRTLVQIELVRETKRSVSMEYMHSIPLRCSFCREVRDAIRKRVRRAHIVDAFVYSQILIAAQNPSGQPFVGRGRALMTKLRAGPASG